MSAGDAPGFIAAQHCRNIEDADTVIGTDDWRSNEERLAWSQSLDPGTREQLMELLATPMRETAVSPRASPVRQRESPSTDILACRPPARLTPLSPL